jgi:Beta/Gamma crystallin
VSLPIGLSLLLAGPSQADDIDPAQLFARLYDSADQTGKSMEIRAISPELNRECPAANSSSCPTQFTSVFVSGPLKLVLWSEPNYQGRTIVLGPGKYNLKDYGFERVASSGAVYVYNDGAVPFFNKYYKYSNESRVFLVGAKTRCFIADDAQMQRLNIQPEAVIIASRDMVLPVDSKQCP